MAKAGIIAAGAVLMILAMIGYAAPITDEGYTIPGTDAICSGGLGQFGQTFSGEIPQVCSQYKMMTMGIYGLGIVGIILLIVGAVVPSKSNKQKDAKSLDILKDRYAKGEITKEKFDEMRKNLDD